MHILLINQAPIPVFAYGGTERVIWDLGKMLVELGHRVSYLVPSGSHCNFAQVLEINKSKSWEEQIPDNVDVAHFQFNPEKEPDRPYLVTEHGNTLNAPSLPRNTVFLSQNHAQRYGSNLFVYNGLDWGAYGAVNFNQQRTRYHFLGKAAWRVKNVRGAITVARQAGVELNVLGGNRIQFKRGLRFTLSRNIHFHGMVGGIQKFSLLNASRGLIFPVCWHEPFGLAIIESLYFGCPVFATPYGALPELVPPECGVLSAHSEELAAAIRSAHFDPHACHQQAITRFNAKRMAQDYAQIYARVIAGEQLHHDKPFLLEPARNLPWD